MSKNIDFSQVKFIDLTHTLSAEIPHWGAGCGFNHRTIKDYDDSHSSTKFRVHKIDAYAGIGTHMDAPAHCIPHGHTIADIPLEQLIAPCVMIDVSAQAHENYCMEVAPIKQFENQYGVIADGSLVIIYTGWDKYWNQAEKYRNNLIFPSISEQAAQFLLQRNIVGLGIDTLSPDNVNSSFPVHQLLLGAGKYIIENVAHAKQLPPIGAYSFALPIKIQDGTEAPIRLVGMITP